MDPMNVPAKFEVGSFTPSWDNIGFLKTLDSPCIRRSRSSQVIDFGTNRKRVCDFLLDRHSNLASILHRLGDMTGFFVLLSDPTPIPPKFAGCSRHQIAHVGVSPSRSFKLFGREIIFQEFQPVWKTYLNVTNRQTGRQTIYRSRCKN